MIVPRHTPTDRRPGDDALAQSRERLRQLAEQLAAEHAHLVAAQAVAKMGSWSTDLGTMAVTWSAETHRIFETDPSSFAPTHTSFLERVHPADRDAVDAAFLASLNGRAVNSIEHRVTMPDHRLKWVVEIWHVVSADNATPLRAVGTIQDITERKEAEARLRTIDARLRAVLTSAPLVIFAVDDRGTLTLAEGKGLARVGLTPHQLVGRPADAVFAGVRLARLDRTVIAWPDAIRRVLSGDAVSGLTAVEGEYFESHFFPEHDASGIVTGMIGVCTVVTARYQAEARLSESLAELKAVSTRLSYAREQERAKIARDIHDHLGQAMTALKMDVAEIHRRLRAGDMSAASARLADMSALIDQSVDDVRRVATALLPVVLDDLGFVAAVRAYCVDVGRRARIRCVLRTSLTDLEIARERAIALFRILQEALTNVVRHAEATGVVVDMRLEDGRVRLSVEDNGRGMPDTPARHPAPLGIVGMRDRARLLGGDVSVHSRMGQGTTVMADLPLAAGTE